MKKAIMLLALLGLIACSRPAEDIDDGNNSGEEAKEEYVEEKSKGLLSRNEDKKVPKDKESLQDVERKTQELKNPKPNEKPEKSEDDKKTDRLRRENETVTVSPGQLEKPEGTEDTQGTSADFIKKPSLKINSSSYDAPLVDVSLVGEDEELYNVENRLGVNITVIDVDTEGERVLMVPRYYHGMLKINKISYNEDKDGYDIGDEIVNVYMSDADAILLRADLDEERPSYLLSYYDEAGDYQGQSFLDYSEDDNSLKLNDGFNFTSN